MSHDNQPKNQPPFYVDKDFGIRNKILLEYLVKSKSKFTESHSGSFEVIPGH